MHTDDTIIQRTLSGDLDAYRHLVDRYQDRVASVCLNMLKDPSTAEEVGQETFIRLYKSLGTFKGNSSLSTYITRIAINLCLNKLKQIKKRRERYAELPEHGVDRYGSTEMQDQAEAKEIIELGLQALKPIDRSVVVLRMIEGYSIKETSAMLGISEGTVMSKLSRAIKKMHEVLTNSKIYNGKP